MIYILYTLYLPLCIILSDWFAVLRVPTIQLKYLKPMQRNQNPCLSMFLVLMNIPSMEIPPTVVLKKVVAETEIQIQLRILRFTPSKKSPFTKQKLSKSTSNYKSLWIRCKSIPASIFFLMNRYEYIIDLIPLIQSGIASTIELLLSFNLSLSCDGIGKKLRSPVLMEKHATFSRVIQWPVPCDAIKDTKQVLGCHA